MKDTIHSLSEKIKRRAYEFEDFIFEKWNSLDLGMIAHADLVSDSEGSLQHATAYQAVWCRNLREIFREARKTGIVFQNFIDIGSGKGKACFYAYKKKYFKKIIGIDFSKQLIDISIENSRRSSCRDILFTHDDATKFHIPDGNNFIFMFNPFDEIILNNFIANNITHFTKFDSIIAYANDIHRKKLIDLGFNTIFRNENRRISIYKFS